MTSLLHTSCLAAFSSDSSVTLPAPPKERPRVSSLWSRCTQWPGPAPFCAPRQVLISSLCNGTEAVGDLTLTSLKCLDSQCCWFHILFPTAGQTGFPCQLAQVLKTGPLPSECEHDTLSEQLVVSRQHPKDFLNVPFA